MATIFFMKFLKMVAIFCILGYNLTGQILKKQKVYRTINIKFCLNNRRREFDNIRRCEAK